MNILPVKLNSSCNIDTLKDNGFLSFSSTFFYKRDLYQKKYSLNISIDKNLDSIKIDVFDVVNKCNYKKFSNKKLDENDSVLRIVVARYNQIIQELIDKRILILDN